MIPEIHRDERTWTLGATWLSFPRRPTRRVLRQNATAYGATHYAFYGDRKCNVAFFDFGKQRRKTVSALADAVAAKIGPRSYAEIELEPGRLWIVATGGDGRLLPATDTIIGVADRKAFHSRLSEEMLSARREISFDAFDQLLGQLSGTPVKLHEVSQRGALRNGMIVLACVGVVAAGMHLWTMHEQAEQQEEARLEQQRAEQLRLQAALLPTKALPNDWLAACLKVVDNTSPFRGGWVLASWACQNSGITLTWNRRGGTLADAPDGTIDQNGDRIVESRPLHPVLSRNAPRRKGDGLRQLLAMIQGIGSTPQVSTGFASGAQLPVDAQGRPVPPPTDVTFQWPTDPRSTDWNAVPGLTLVSLTHDTGADLSGSSSAAGTYGVVAAIEKEVQR